MQKGNRGEWSEVYVLLKLLADKELLPGDDDLEKLPGIVYPIIAILRQEVTQNSYSYEGDLVLIENDGHKTRVPIQKFATKASLLLDRIKTSTTTTFEVPELNEFLVQIKCGSLKAKSSVKSDINIIIHDQRTGLQPDLGFSIKSQLGNPSTLLNAGKTTNFIYEVSGINLSDSQIDELNQISTKSKIKDRVNSIISLGGSINFNSISNPIFNNNLILIDSRLPEIIANVVYRYYLDGISSTKELTAKVSQLNPLNFDKSSGHTFYQYKVKHFLTDIALGMMPSKTWTGQYEANGGYLVVKSNGEILCYHIYNKNRFEDYLLSHTKLETASSTRHNFGHFYKDEDGKTLLNLNLQIRFKN